MAVRTDTAATAAKANDACPHCGATHNPSEACAAAGADASEARESIGAGAFLARAPEKKSRSVRSLILDPSRHARNASYAAFAEINPDVSLGDYFTGFRQVEADIADITDDHGPSDHAFSGMLVARHRMISGMTGTPAKSIDGVILKATAARDIVTADRHMEPEAGFLLVSILRDLDDLRYAA